MSAVSTTIDIAAPPQTVWDVMLDAQRTKEWVTIVREVGDVDSGPLRPGFKMAQTFALRGIPFHVHWVLQEVRVPSFACWEGKGPARSKAFIEYRLEELPDGGTRVTYKNEFKTPLGPLGAVASKALIGGIPEHEAKASLQKLKQLLEQ
ncbi:MAG: SRPBCC family protein [Solirubrobacteraceae bacterium]|nr:SRPBCC family protein [Solirubrobacteraceae bacterium]